MGKKIIIFFLSIFTILKLLCPDVFAKYVIENVVTAVKINIDRTMPVATVSYSTTDETNDNVIVSILFSEPIEAVDGWEMMEDKLTIRKTYEENTIETIVIRDLAQNENSVEINVQNIYK